MSLLLYYIYFSLLNISFLSLSHTPSLLTLPHYSHSLTKCLTLPLSHSPSLSLTLNASNYIYITPSLITPSLIYIEDILLQYIFNYQSKLMSTII